MTTNNKPAHFVLQTGQQAMPRDWNLKGLHASSSMRRKTT
jgi:hypothetical protein